MLLVLGLSVKVPVFPLHTWLPPAHTTAPTAGSVLLAAVLLKMGTYGLVRLPVATVPDGFGRLAPVLAVAGVVGIVWGALVCLVERDLKRLIAYSSVAHMGFVALALAAGSETGLQAALFANIAHGVISALLFFLVGGLKQRWGSVDLAVARPALRETSPRLGFLLILGLAASLGLPGLAGFWGEFFSVYAAWLPAADRPRALFVGCAVVAAVGAALAAGYALRVARTVWVGDRPDPEAAAATPDTRGVELVVLAVLGTLVVVLGVLPGPLLAVTADAAALIAGGAPVIAADLVTRGCRQPRPGAAARPRCGARARRGCRAARSPLLAAAARRRGARDRRRHRAGHRPARRRRPGAHALPARPRTAPACGPPGRPPARCRPASCWPPPRRSRCSTTGPRAARHDRDDHPAARRGHRWGRGRGLARPRHLAGHPRARDRAGRGAGRAARHAHGIPRRPHPARHVGDVVRAARARGGPVADRHR